MNDTKSSKQDYQTERLKRKAKSVLKTIPDNFDKPQVVHDVTPIQQTRSIPKIEPKTEYKEVMIPEDINDLSKYSSGGKDISVWDKLIIAADLKH